MRQKQPEMVQMKRDDSLTEPRKPEISLDFINIKRDIPSDKQWLESELA